MDLFEKERRHTKFKHTDKTIVIKKRTKIIKKENFYKMKNEFNTQRM